MVGTWVYIIYEKVHPKKPLVNTVYLKDTSSSAKKILPDTFAKKTVPVVEVPLKPVNSGNNPATEKDLAAKIAEINMLRAEISSLVKKNSLNDKELQDARKKISDMQDLVNQLQNENTSLTQNNSKLNTALDEAGNEIKKWKAEVENLAKNKTNSNSAPGSVLFELSDLKLTPINETENNEAETSSATNTDKFSVSFAVKNNTLETPLAELYAVLIQPDGRIYQPDVWDSYTITTDEGRRKPITKNIKFDYAKGDIKRLNFSLSPTEIQRGNYTLQIYQNQKLIGETYRLLQ